MSYSANLLANKAAVNTDVTTKTSPSSITPTDVGGDIEALIDTIITGDIDAVVSLGNTINNQSINIKNGLGATVIELNSTGNLVSKDGGSAAYTQLYCGASEPFRGLYWYDGTHTAILQQPNLTSDRNYTPPNRTGLLQLSGDQLNPSYVLGAGAGTGATFSFSPQSDDRKGIMTIVTGTGCTSSDEIVKVIFYQPYSLKTTVCISAANPLTALDFNRFYVGPDAAGYFTIVAAGVALTDSTTYVLKYIVAN